MKKTIFIIISVILFFIFIELICLAAETISISFFERTIFKLKTTLDERNLLYKYDRIFGWFPKKNYQASFKGYKKISVQSNSLGFRDAERKNKKVKPRIMFIGDSFVWGYDVEQNERFTEKIQKKLKNYEIINCGVSGYGTDQEYLIFKKYFSTVDPDIVFLLFCDNDRIENTLNSRIIYYKPYLVIENNEIVLKGIPVPKSLNYYYNTIFSRSTFLWFCVNLYDKFFIPKITVADISEKIIFEMKKELDSINIPLVIGLINRDDKLEKFCVANDIHHVVLKNEYIYHVQGNHWTPKGHNFAAEKIMDFLVTKNMLKN